MGLEVNTSQNKQEETDMTDGYKLKERLYKTEDGEIVREGDPRGATLYKGVGKTISFEEAKAIGLDTEETPTPAPSGGGEAGGEEDLTKLKREQLDELAAELGVEDAEKLDTKADVIAAIETARQKAAESDD